MFLRDEIALFLGRSEEACFEKLNSGFGPLHNEVTANFNSYLGIREGMPHVQKLHQEAAKIRDAIRAIEERAEMRDLIKLACVGDITEPSVEEKAMLQHLRLKEAQLQRKLDWEILNWYAQTEAYIWELSAYHADAGFNYSGMCQGIAERLKADGAKKVLCLGDGIGDLTLGLIRAGFDATYHDLAGSRTAEFAQFRFWMYLGHYAPVCLTRNWEPDLGYQEYDAIVSLDFLEHVTDVDAWLQAIQAAGKPGALFGAQNAFACGSGAEGSMPMHLARNDRFEKDWDPTLFKMGFTQLSSNWYRAPMEEQVELPVAA